jgi:putative peptidoglycan lipid II flippase
MVARVSEAPTATRAADPGASSARPRAGALLVAAGILLSRLSGLVRQRVFGHYLGTSAAADAYTAALRIPNVLQNLLGEGVLSASFIPVYAALRARGTPEAERDARRVAGAVAGLLGLCAGLFALLGMALTPWLIDLIAPGFRGETRALAMELVRIFFPGISLLVLSAYCLGVLNSHRRFFLSYAAPVVWNAAIVAALVLGGQRFRLGQFDLARVAAWGMVAGSALQLGVQVPSVLRLLGGPRAALRSLGLGRGDLHVAEVVSNFFPVLAGRGVVQISAWVDTVIASWLPEGALAAMNFAQILYTLPVSLFGMSISAAALPSMSETHGQEEQQRTAALREELRRGLAQMAFPVVASAVAFAALGDVICAALYQTGRFTSRDSTYVWAILAGSTVGLLAQTQGRLYSSTYYALRDTRTPLRFALVRVSLTAGLGLLAALWLPGVLGLAAKWGAVGLTASAGVAGWVEFLLLRRGLAPRIGRVGLDAGLQLRLWSAALLAGAAGWGVKLLLPRLPGARVLTSPWPQALAVLGAFGLVYLGATLLLRVPEAKSAIRRVMRRRKQGSAS